jgi:FkbM family methyltransferase
MIKKFAVAAIVATGVVLFSLWFFPGLTLLGAPRMPTSPYCSRWRAALDASIKVEQFDRARRIGAASTIVRRDGSLDLWQTPAGQWWVPAGNAEILPILLAQQERSIYGAINPGDVVMDIGAHIGTFARTALSAGAAKVIAVEPSPLAVQALERNFAAEIASGRLVVVPKGVWDQEQTLTLFDNGPGAAGDSFVSAAPGARRVESIPVTTIDAIVQALGVEQVHLIKADVKGATERAIAGSPNTIARWRPRWAISTESPPENPATIAALLKGYVAEGGPCFFTDGEIRTDVMFFR